MLGIFWGLKFRRSDRLLYQVGSINGLRKNNHFLELTSCQPDSIVRNL